MTFLGVVVILAGLGSYFVLWLVKTREDRQQRISSRLTESATSLNVVTTGFFRGTDSADHPLAVQDQDARGESSSKSESSPSIVPDIPPSLLENQPSDLSKSGQPVVKFCTNCGSEILDFAEFCHRCGQQIVAVMYCSSCGKQNVDRAKFCSSCGARMAETVGTHVPTVTDSPGRSTNTDPHSEPSLSLGEELKAISFSDALNRAFSQYAVFSGRASRGENWYFTIFLVAGGAILNLVEVVLLDVETPFVFSLLFTLGTLLPAYSVVVRRLHDVGRSGWWVLLPITIIGVIPYLYWTYFKKSDRGGNRFGPSPFTS